MIIEVNGERTELETTTTVAELLAKLKVPQEGTAVAINDSIVPKSTFAQRTLEPQDKVDIFSLVAGG